MQPAGELQNALHNLANVSRRVIDAAGAPPLATPPDEGVGAVVRRALQYALRGDLSSELNAAIESLSSQETLDPIRARNQLFGMPANGETTLRKNAEMALRRHGLGPATYTNGLRDGEGVNAVLWSKEESREHIRKTAFLLIADAVLERHGAVSSTVRSELEELRLQADVVTRKALGAQRALVRNLPRRGVGCALSDARLPTFAEVADVDANAEVDEIGKAIERYASDLRWALRDLPRTSRMSRMQALVLEDVFARTLVAKQTEAVEARARTPALTGQQRMYATLASQERATEYSNISWYTNDLEEARRRYEAQTKDPLLNTQASAEERENYKKASQLVAELLRWRLDKLESSIQAPSDIDPSETVRQSAMQPTVGQTLLHAASGQRVTVQHLTPDPEGAFVVVQRTDGSVFHTTADRLSTLQEAPVDTPVRMAKRLQDALGALPSVEEAERALRLKLCTLISVHAH